MSAWAYRVELRDRMTRLRRPILATVVGAGAGSDPGRGAAQHGVRGRRAVAGRPGHRPRRAAAGAVARMVRAIGPGSRGGSGRGPGLIGVYGGYFGAAQGVMLMAVLGLVYDADPQRANGAKNILAACANVTAARRLRAERRRRRGSPPSPWPRARSRAATWAAGSRAACPERCCGRWWSSSGSVPRCTSCLAASATRRLYRGTSEPRTGEDGVTVVKRVVLGVAGVLLLLAGLAAGGLAAWGSAVFGSDGALRFDAGTITPVPGLGRHDHRRRTLRRHGPVRRQAGHDAACPSPPATPATRRPRCSSGLRGPRRSTPT